MDPAVEWLESVAMRPMLEALLESVCKDKPDDLMNYAIAWMRTSYPDASAEAAAAAEESGPWAPVASVDATPDGLMNYLRDINATVVLEGIIERAIRATPINVVAYVVDELAALRGGIDRPSHVMDATPGVGSVVAETVEQATQGNHPKAHELIDAIGDGDAERVEQLLIEGVPAGTRDASGLKTAMMAAAEGETECLRLLLQHGAPLDVQNKLGETALIAAVKYAEGEITQLLIEAGADPHLRDIKGMSAVDHAKVRMRTPPCTARPTRSRKTKKLPKEAVV